MDNIKTLTEKLNSEGFKHIYEWTDKSNKEYSAHKHKDKVSFYVIDGDIVMDIEGKSISIKKGERFDVPVGKTHSAKVGKSGCHFLVGEMINGDA